MRAITFENDRREAARFGGLTVKIDARRFRLCMPLLFCAFLTGNTASVQEDPCPGAEDIAVYCPEPEPPLCMNAEERSVLYGGYSDPELCEIFGGHLTYCRFPWDVIDEQWERLGHDEYLVRQLAKRIIGQALASDLAHAIATGDPLVIECFALTTADLLAEVRANMRLELEIRLSLTEILADALNDALEALPQPEPEPEEEDWIPPPPPAPAPAPAPAAAEIAALGLSSVPVSIEIRPARVRPA